MGWLILLHGVVALAVIGFGRTLGRESFTLAAVAPALTFGWLVANAPSALEGGLGDSVTWVGALGLDLDVRLDGMGLLMALLVSGIGVLVLGYSRWYFASRSDNPKIAALLVAFAGAMFGLVVADNVLLLFTFWELTTVASFLLIGVDDERAAARASAQQAFLVTGIGGLAMLAGLVLLSQAAGTWSLSGLLADPPSGGVVTAALALVLVGAFTKSAQVPFHFWLPGAMAAPTPISTYLHSATMVKAGVYLVALLAPAFAGSVGWWRPVVVGVGVVTMVWGGARALRQFDLKLLAAHGTVSQLGFMMALVGAGVPALTFAGCAVILAHALFKAAIFMVVGIVDHGAGSRDIRHLSDVGRRMPATAALAVIAVASMAGIPPLLGFVAKESAFEGLAGQLSSPGWLLALVGVLGGSALTFAYGARFLLGGFTRSWLTPTGEREATHGHHVGWLPLLAPALLSILTVAAGFAPGLVDPLVAGAATSLDGGSGERLALWHGFTAALGLSVLVLCAGSALVAARRSIERLQQRLGGFPGGAELYAWCMRRLLHGADRITAVVQSGSLPIYLGVILATAVALPASALIQVRGVDLSVGLAENPMQAVVAGIVVACALATAFARRRFAAVLLVGAVGYGVTVLFVIQGAPDLALTQLVVETLTLVMFVLVMRHLPDRFRATSGALARSARVVIAVAVGVLVSAFALVAAASRTVPPISQEHLARAEPDGGGLNVVNVILVDIRGLDTLGEITVIATAALGVMALGGATLLRRSKQGNGEEVAARAGA